MTISGTVCPGCRERAEIGPRIRKGDWVTCSRCGADLEVISVDPLMLDWAYDGPEADFTDKLAAPAVDRSLALGAYVANRESGAITAARCLGGG